MEDVVRQDSAAENKLHGIGGGLGFPVDHISRQSCAEIPQIGALVLQFFVAQHASIRLVCESLQRQDLLLDFAEQGGRGVWVVFAGREALVQIGGEGCDERNAGSAKRL